MSMWEGGDFLEGEAYRNSPTAHCPPPTVSYRGVPPHAESLHHGVGGTPDRVGPGGGPGRAPPCPGEVGPGPAPRSGSPEPAAGPGPRVGPGWQGALWARGAQLSPSLTRGAQSPPSLMPWAIGEEDPLPPIWRG
jgi:hypothetical protein